MNDDTDEEYPRILIVSQSGRHVPSNTGLTFASLFNGWPRERIHELYSEEWENEGRRGADSWNITLDSVAAYRLAFARELRRPRHLTTRGVAGPIGVHAGRVTQRMKAVAVGRAFADLLPFEVPRALWKWLEEFQPEVVFSPLGSVRWAQIVAEIAEERGLPVVPFFGDDWPAVLYHFSRWVDLPRRRLADALTRVLRRAPLILCGSDLMAAEYESRFGIRSTGFMRCVETSGQPPTQRAMKPPLVLMYVGGLHLGRAQVLDRLGDALVRLGEKGVDVQLLVYAPQQDVIAWSELLKRPGRVEIRGTLAPECVRKELLAADVLVHVEAFDERVTRYTRLSLSTKIPEYLVSARPILMIGAAGLSSVEYIRGSGAGVVVDELSVAAMERAVERLYCDGELRTACSHAGWTRAVARHGRDSETSRLRRELKAAVTSWERRQGRRLRRDEVASTSR